jgi:hypothetical protein
MILSRLSEFTLNREALATTFPKWNTLCLLRSLHLPTLDAAFLRPGVSISEAKTLIKEFAISLGVDHLLVRSDGGREVTQYYRGGCTLPLDNVVETAGTLLNLKRAVILLEPTNRFENYLTVNFLADFDGRFVIEALGPGYDVADLNRAGTPAHYVVYGVVGNWCEYNILSIADIKGVPSSIDEETRRKARLLDIGTRLLPSMGVKVKGSPVAFAEHWLQSNGYIDLWRPWRFNLSLSQIQSWYEDAFVIANFLGRNQRWKTFVLSWSRLHDYRCVYWDVVDAKTKFALLGN